MYYSEKELERIRKQGEEYAEKLEQQAKGQKFNSAAGTPITCIHCHHDHFHQGKALLNTRGLTFFDLEWLNESANTLMCVKCGYIQWFGKEVQTL